VHDVLNAVPDAELRDEASKLLDVILQCRQRFDFTPKTRLPQLDAVTRLWTTLDRCSTSTGMTIFFVLDWTKLKGNRSQNLSTMRF